MSQKPCISKLIRVQSVSLDTKLIWNSKLPLSHYEPKPSRIEAQTQWYVRQYWRSGRVHSKSVCTMLDFEDVGDQEESP